MWICGNVEPLIETVMKDRIKNNHEFSFEKVEVWKLSVKLVKEIYTLTKNFSDSE